MRTAETEASTGKVTVTGTMDANKLVEYVYRRTKKQAKIVPQPEPEKPAEEPKPEESKPEEAKPAEEAKPGDGAAEKKDGDGEKPPEEEKKEGGEEQAGEDKKEGEEIIPIGDHDQMNINKMMYYYQPLYVIERIPPPQLFSDENPNACCIT